jgi:flagellar basal body-associated protein FliL
MVSIEHGIIFISGVDIIIIIIIVIICLAILLWWFIAPSGKEPEPIQTEEEKKKAAWLKLSETERCKILQMEEFEKDRIEKDSRDKQYAYDTLATSLLKNHPGEFYTQERIRQELNATNKNGHPHYFPRTVEGIRDKEIEGTKYYWFHDPNRWK